MFLPTKRAEGFDDRSPWGSFWFEPLGSRTMTGVNVSPRSAMQLSAVFACVRVLAESFAILPFKLYRKAKPGGKRVEITDHWLVRLMRKPNDFQNGFEWREMMQGHIALRGAGYNVMAFGEAGAVTSLMPLHPDRVQTEILKTGDYRYRYKNPDGTDTLYARDEIFRIAGMSDDGVNALNPIELARETIGLGLSAQEYGSRFFQNNASPGGGWIEHPGTFKDKAARDNFREQLQNAQTGSNRHKTLVLDNAMKYHELGVKNNDAQFLETRQFEVTDIARIFRVPPHLIGDLSKSTNNNIEWQSLEFVKFTMTPHAERWEWKIESDLLLESDDELQPEFGFEGLVRGDSKARTEYYSGGINAGWLTRNEARNAEDLDPIDGLDEPLRPLNMVEETEAQELHDQKVNPPQPPAPPPGEKPPAEGAPPPPAPPKAPPKASAAGVEEAATAVVRLAIERGRVLASAAAERIARREFEAVHDLMMRRQDVGPFYAKHVRFVAAALGVAENVAAQYCAARMEQCTPGVTEEDFQALARCQLERLALRGSL